MKMDFISVIVPAFNSGRWLERTLKSVQKSIDADCEVIIVNDGSTDNTHEIGRKFADEDPRFTVIDIDHVGPCAARKAGFLESHGEYIMFVDSDDLLPVNSISEQRRLLNVNIHNINASLEDEDPGKERPKIIIANTVARLGTRDQLLVSGNMRAITGLEYAQEILTRSLPGFLPGHLYARELIEAIEWDDSPEITHQENFYLLLSFAMKMNETTPDTPYVLVAPAVIGYHYIRRAGSNSALMSLTPRGLERVWNHINRLGLPKTELTLWGLEMLNKVFIERGIPFSTHYSVAADLRKRAEKLGKNLPEKYRPVLEALKSEKKRTAIANKMARTAGLTSVIPHLSVIILAKHNVRKVQRTVASIFGMGFRNLEAIVVDIENTHDEKIALNQLSIQYARVRIVKHTGKETMFHAASTGLHAATGLSVTYARPGDLCCAAGLYDAVTRIDYGADAVLPNYREFGPLTRLRGKIKSYAFLRSTEKSRNATQTAANATENIYPTMVRILKDNDNNGVPLFLYGIVWRTEFIKENEPDADKYMDKKISTISHAYLSELTTNKLQLVTQDKMTSPAFEFADPQFLFRRLKNLFKGKNSDPFKPTYF